eukprot:Em0023g583a
MHFISGKKSDDPLSSHYVPSVFSFVSSPTKQKAEQSLKRYEQRQHLKKIRIEYSKNEVAAEPSLENEMSAEPSLENEVASDPSLVNESAAAISPASEGNTKVVATQTDVLSDVLTTMKHTHSDRKDAGVMTEMLGRYVEALQEEGLESAKRSAALKCEAVGHPWPQDALQ